MARKRPRVVRERRTREHVIADLSAHHVEGPILRCGFTLERIAHDYGLDLQMMTYNADGELEADSVFFQLKATDHSQRTADGTAVIFRIERADLESWLAQTFPVILVVYDAVAGVAYWLYLHADFTPGKAKVGTSRTVTVHIPAENVFDEAAVQHFAAAKAAIQAQTEGVRHHE